MASWVRALKELSRRNPTEEEIKHIAVEILNERSNRGAALIDAAQVEATLQILVKAKLVTLTTDEMESLFERDGPLASFSKLIRVSYAFGIIDSVMQRNLNIVREIRNAFAHSQVQVSFETPAIRSACDLLTPWFENFLVDGMPPEHPRTKFIATTTRLMMVVGNDRKNGWIGPYPLKFD